MKLDDQKLIFVHIPKNAGTSVEHFLSGEKNMDPHRKDLQLVAQIIDGEHQDYYKFTLARNPYARLVSIFKHYSRRGNQSVADAAIGTVLQELGFEGFIANLANLSEILPHFEEIETHLMSQHRYCCDAQKRIVLDHIGRYENLEAEVAELRSRFGIAREFPHKYKTQRTDYSDWFRERALVRTVDEFYEDDFNILGYARL